MLEGLPGVASADADKTTSSATIVYDKSVFDAKSLGDKGRYNFELRQDSAAEGDAAMSKDDEEDSDSMIKIEDTPSGDAESGSGAKADSNIMPSLDGPAS